MIDEEKQERMKNTKKLIRKTIRNMKKYADLVQTND
jgi:hypothetical protein